MQTRFLRSAPGSGTTIRSAFLLGLWMLFLGCGGDAPQEEPGLEDPGGGAPPGSERFSALQPESGDTLVPPRLGFRWEYRDLGASPAGAEPEQQESARDEVLFRVQVLDTSGAVHIDQRTGGRRLLATLPPSSGPGRYIWWLEAYSPVDSQKVAESPRREFEIR